MPASHHLKREQTCRDAAPYAFATFRFAANHSARFRTARLRLGDPIPASLFNRRRSLFCAKNSLFFLLGKTPITRSLRRILGIQAYERSPRTGNSAAQASRSYSALSSEAA